MKTKIDAAGRIVVPKPLRESLGLEPGQKLEIHASDKGFEIEIAPTPMHLKKQGKDVVAIPEVRLPPLRAEEVRGAVDRVRR